MKPYGGAGIRTVALLLAGILSAAALAASGQDAEPFQFFREYVGLNDEQIKNIRSGKAHPQRKWKGNCSEFSQQTAA